MGSKLPIGFLSEFIKLHFFLQNFWGYNLSLIPFGIKFKNKPRDIFNFRVLDNFNPLLFDVDNPNLHLMVHPKLLIAFMLQ